MKTGKCKLCGNDAKLVKCHIVPEALFKYVNDSQIPAKLIANKPEFYPQKSPIGVYDDELVCGECENKFFGDADNYAIRLCCDQLSQLTQNNTKYHNGQKIFEVECNYKSLKMFFISLLWRASASTHVFYSRVNIGSLHSEQLKKNDSRK